MSDQPPWDAFGQQDPRQGQDQDPPYQRYGQQDPNQYQGQPPYPQQQPYPAQPPYQGTPYRQQPYQEGQPYGQQPSPPSPDHGRRRRKSWPARHKILTAIGAVIGLFVALGVIGAVAGAGRAAKPAAQAATAPSYTPATQYYNTSTPTPTPNAPTKVEFIVSGSAPDGIDITYGPAGSNLAGPSVLAGTTTMTVNFDPNADYYAMNAQLQGDGDITCKIVATGPGDQPLTASSGAASGSYNICSAQAAPENNGLSWENEN